MKINPIKKLLFYLLPLALVLAFRGCSDNNPAGPAGDRVMDSYPLALGDTWDYSMEMSISVQEDSTQPPISLSTSGRQHLEIKRTEMITGDEAFGIMFWQEMGRLFDTGLDTTMEVHYLAPSGDKILLKAEEGVYYTGGFIPFSKTSGAKRLGTKIKVGGASRFITLESLARLLLGTAGPGLLAEGETGPALASDGIQKKENVYFYDTEFIFTYSELYKGRSWISMEAGGVGGVEITQKVTNILPELSGYGGPIAEVERSNTLIEAAASEQYKQRYYYKGGVGIVQAEIYDPEFDIWASLPDGSIIYLGRGTWAVIKTLESYQVK
ncbi:MAG TPA: hypothetical protein VM123_00270 [archaeon]|nr:hypothetical protein [archaeon]